MLRNYFKIVWRNLAKEKLYSLIKIGGLSTGVAACLLIALFVRQEVSYDQHYTAGDRIYRILEFSSFRGEVGSGVHFPAPLARTLQAEYPEFEQVGHYNAVEVFGAGSQEVRRSDALESTHDDGFVYASQELLSILQLPFLQGNPQQALTEPNTIVITKRKADTYFPGQNPIGKLLILNNDKQRQYRVSGVIEDFPVTSHFQYNFLMTLAGKEFGEGEQTNWRNSNYINYVRVRSGTDIGQLEHKLSGVVKKYFMPAASREGANHEEMAWLNSFRFKLQPVRAIYLNEDRVQDGLPHGDIRYIWLFGAIALFILLIASINFINLSTAKSANRAKEVGLRKVVGSLRRSLIGQFLTESLLFSSVSVVLGLLLANLLLPYFNGLVAKSLVFPWREWWLFPVLAIGTLLLGLLAGLYPAFYLSAFQPMQVLKGTVSRGSKHASTRSLLVVFQFTVSTVLIVGTFTIARQMHFILNKKLGFDKEQVLVLQGTHTLANQLTPFKNELLRLPDVKQASVSSFLPVEGTKRNNGGMWTQGMQDHEKVSSQHWNVDDAYVKTLGLKLVQGRNFSAQMLTDSQSVIINESLVKALHLRHPIGQRIFNWRGGWTVIGVVEDFHFNSLKEKIQPMGLFLGRSPNTILVKVATQDMAATLQSVTNVWKQFSPYQPIRYSFLDEQYASMYNDVQRTQRIFSSFAGLAILIACLGLFALSAFMAEQRSKEISIRKVLGASLNSILGLLAGNFIKLVLISFGIAAPIGWYLMSNWLNDFVYRIPLGWEIFLLAGLSTIGIALLTVSFQSIKAALMNPVKSLRSE
ncbi:hypothetical protein AWR27_18065 [Spirosoma montaniterrae]|uniref:Cell division protein FtsX n=2 Tax=Spirosoma montaniterrae TaxID=1178516 RepID=A0A1P9X4I8_9BACT|nr:hypothetical protein AWR27_18065 [Spirosoma montaniterrae]